MGRLDTGLVCALAVGIASIAHAEQPSNNQKISLISKPSVVRVWGAYIAQFEVLGSMKVNEAIGGTGTGWFVTPDGYIATNAHVVADIHNGDDIAKKALFDELLKDLDKKYRDEIARMSEGEKQKLVNSIKLLDLKKRAYVVLPNGDKLDYEIKQYGKPGTGNDAAIIKVKIENAPTIAIGDSKKSQVEDHVVVIGYPGVADFEDLLDEKSQLQATVTDGAISSLKQATTGEQILQTSASITHGNSGGPAIDQHGNVIGLATFGNEGAVQGFNFLVASATLMELVKAAKIEPKQSDTNKAWNSGLESYWNDEYSDAITKFEEVQMLFPQHSEAASFIRNAHQAKKDGKEKKSSSNAGAIVAVAIGGGLVLLIAIFVLARKNKGPRPGIPVGAPMGHPGMHPPGMPPGMHPGMQPGMQPPGAPPMMPPPAQGFGPQQQMYGRAPQPQGSATPVAKTVAVGQSAQASGGIAPTAFGSLSIGNLTCTRGQLMGQRFALTATGIIVGRQPGVAHVLVNDHRASGKHVWIGIENGRLVAIDQGTTNGTYVNDIARGRITRAELRDGDIVIVSEPDCCSLQLKLG
jgi:S1-C subfamily serine protease